MKTKIFTIALAFITLNAFYQITAVHPVEKAADEMLGIRKCSLLLLFRRQIKPVVCDKFQIKYLYKKNVFGHKTIFFVVVWKCYLKHFS